ncbi:MAG: AzlD domain-containing protein [Desulfovibrionaceae bacterium]
MTSAVENVTTGLGGLSGIWLWLLFLACGLVTVCERLSFILVFGRREMPAWLLRALRYVPPAVLSALVFPAILRHGGQLDISLDNHRLLAALLACVVAWRFKNLLWTIVTGMVALWLLSAFA